MDGPVQRLSSAQEHGEEWEEAGNFAAANEGDVEREKEVIRQAEDKLRQSEDRVLLICAYRLGFNDHNGPEELRVKLSKFVKDLMSQLVEGTSDSDVDMAVAEGLRGWDLA